MTTLTKAQSEKILKNAVDQLLNKNVHYNDVSRELLAAGIDMDIIMDFDKTKKRIGLANNWILSDKAIDDKVLASTQGKELLHFLDVFNLAKEVSPSIPLKNVNDVFNIIARVAKLDSTKIKENSESTKLRNEGKVYGDLYHWIMENPDFTSEQILKSKVISAPNSEKYLQQAIAMREFFFNLYEMTHDIKGGTYRAFDKAEKA